MSQVKRSTGIIVISTIVVAALLYALIFALQKSDASTIKVATDVEAFVIRYCKATTRVPSMRALAARFPHLRNASGWVFFSDARRYLKMQYPVKWWNGNAVGVAKLSEFTDTPYAYVLEYRCGKSK